MKDPLLPALMLFIFLNPIQGQRDFSTSDITKLIILGSGNPNPSPDQSGCALALLVNQTPYIVDFGPGLIRKAAALSPRYGGPLENFQNGLPYPPSFGSYHRLSRSDSYALGNGKG